MADTKNTWYEEIIEDTEAYRDKIATVDDQGHRIWMYPKKPVGKYYNRRNFVALLFVILFVATPFIKVNGEPFMLFNVLERKFVLFGILFTPQDFHLFVLAMLTFFVFIILFTVVYGRLFCGWVCPQTVFMEMIFRKIEYAIEGDGQAQRKLDAAPWTASKIRKKALKHAVFFGIAVFVSNFFLAYIIGADQVLNIIREPVSKNFGGFVAMMVFSGAFYLVFARLREQVCTTICPYGRMQGVLLVKDSIVVAYDHVRGEPRGKLKKHHPASEPGSGSDLGEAAHKTKGDCVDCNLCVAVCPTGIDIRNGTQLECVNCTACIDACDGVMEKIGKPTNLIRYDSMKGIETGKRRIFTPRVLAYTAVLLALVALDVALIANRGMVESIILRSPGQMYQQTDATHLTNLYTFKIINKSPNELAGLHLQLAEPKGVIRMVGAEPATLAKGHTAQGAFFVELAENQLKGLSTPIVIHVYAGGNKIDAVKTSFLGSGAVKTSN